jgi:hypothetical protein
MTNHLELRQLGLGAHWLGFGSSFAEDSEFTCWGLWVILCSLGIVARSSLQMIVGSLNKTLKLGHFLTMSIKLLAFPEAKVELKKLQLYLTHLPASVPKALYQKQAIHTVLEALGASSREILLFFLNVTN